MIGRTFLDGMNSPRSFVLFLGDQEGLRVDRQPISSRQDLERAFYLLHIKGDPQRFSIVTLAFRVLFAYGQKISRPRKPSVDLLLSCTPLHRTLFLGNV